VEYWDQLQAVEKFLSTLSSYEQALGYRCFVWGLLALDRFARLVCNDEITDLTSRVPPHPFFTKHRRESQRAEGERLARHTTEWAGANKIPFGDFDPRLQSLTTAVFGAMNLLGRSWWPTCPQEAIEATNELRGRIEKCRDAGIALLRFGQYHGFPVPLAPDPTDKVPPTWDDVLKRMSDWEARLKPQDRRDDTTEERQARLERARSREKEIDKVADQRCRAENLRDNLRGVHLTGPNGEGADRYAATLLDVVAGISELDHMTELDALRAEGNDAKAEAVAIYQLAKSRSNRQLIVDRIKELSKPGHASFSIEVDHWLRVGIPLAVFEDLLPIPRDKWDELEQCCKNAEMVIRLLDCNGDMEGIKEQLKGLWDRADWAGGLEDLPPPMPEIKDKGDALRADAMLLQWVRAHKDGRQPDPCQSETPTSPSVAGLLTPPAPGREEEGRHLSDVSVSEVIEAVKRRIYGDRYAGLPGAIPAWPELPALLQSIIHECKRLGEDRTALREFRERLLQSFRAREADWTWTTDLADAWGRADSELNDLRDRLNEDQGDRDATEPMGSKRRKRSTQRGEGEAKLIAALSEHHRYSDGSCLNQVPIGNNELAEQAHVSPSTASAFFGRHFQGYAKYRAICRDPGKLADSLKVLNGEFSPHHLYGRRPPGEGDREGEDDE
jgi:hypothetical protein